MKRIHFYRDKPLVILSALALMLIPVTTLVFDIKVRYLSIILACGSLLPVIPLVFYRNCIIEGDGYVRIRLNKWFQTYYFSFSEIERVYVAEGDFLTIEAIDKRYAVFDISNIHNEDVEKLLALFSHRCETVIETG